MMGGVSLAMGEDLCVEVYIDTNHPQEHLVVLHDDCDFYISLGNYDACFTMTTRLFTPYSCYSETEGYQLQFSAPLHSSKQIQVGILNVISHLFLRHSTSSTYICIHNTHHE